MKKNVLLLALAMLLTFGSAFAGDISVQDAQTVAVNFFKITLGNNAPRLLSATLQYTRTETDNTVDFYVFQMAPVKGFVIVSATNNDEPIIGYSTESYFSNDFSKIGLTEWLNRWSEEIHYVKLNNVIATTTAASHWAAYLQGVAPASQKSGGVTPFCQTTWDQNTEYSSGPNLYNNFCPGGTGTNQAVTGCVATAMAQIMKYWNYPTKGIGSNSYSDERSQGYQENYGTLSANFADSVFDWASMETPMLTSTSTTTQINAIGMLMSCAGIAVDMDYSPNGSGAVVLTSEADGSPCAQTAYVQNFGYQTVIQGIVLTGTGESGGISSAAFTDSIEADLTRGRLVQVQGTDQTYGGHTWVCDGYETSPSTMFHMNWGWSGYSDGYFALTNLDPNDGDALNFSEDIGALIHIIPPVTAVLPEVATATPATGVCPGSTTQLKATQHSGATYSWMPTTGLNNASIYDPVASPTLTTTYTVTVDSAGITGSSSITVTVHSAPSAIMGSSSNPTCYGSSNGSITVAGSGGTPGYSYKWNDNQTTATASNLPQGTYTVTVTDANTCTATASKTLTQPASALTVSTTNIVNATCGQSNGSVGSSVTGGTSGYTYLWSNGATTATASNLSGATYTLTVTDAHGCSTTASATISSSGTLNLVTTVTNASCYGEANGSATATVTGNTGNVSYDWSNGATTSSIQDVIAATYTVTVSDGSGCSASSSKTVSQPAALSAAVNVSNTGCGSTGTGSASLTVSGGTSGYSYLWSNGGTTSSISGLNAGTYDVTITDAHSCSTTADAVIGNSGGLNIVPTATNTGCGNAATGSVSISATGGTGYHYSWSNGATTSSISGLSSGTYVVTVTDAGNCSASVSAVVSTPSPLSVVVTSNNAACYGEDDGSAQVNVSNGLAPFVYDWSNGATTASLSNIGAGSYTVTITDANSCSSIASLSLTQPGQIHVITSATNATGSSDDGSATAIVSSGGVAPYTYHWNIGDTAHTINNLSPGTYYVTVTDAHGCNQTASATVNVSTGISNISDPIAFSIYPNPAHNYVLIQLNEFNGSTTLNLKNILGQTVITQTVTAQQTQLELNTLANGVYLVELVQGDKRAVKQLVIVK